MAPRGSSTCAPAGRPRCRRAPPAHAPPCLRVQARQRWPRHARPAALPRAQEHPAHGPVHRHGARPLQRLLEGLTNAGCFPRAGTPLRQIVRSRVHWRWHTLPRLALLRRNRGVDVFEQPVRTLVLGLLKLGWTQHSNGFRSALDDRSARRSPALQHALGAHPRESRRLPTPQKRQSQSASSQKAFSSLVSMVAALTAPPSGAACTAINNLG